MVCGKSLPGLGFLAQLYSLVRKGMQVPWVQHLGALAHTLLVSSLPARAQCGHIEDVVVDTTYRGLRLGLRWGAAVCWPGYCCEQVRE